VNLNGCGRSNKRFDQDGSTDTDILPALLSAAHYCAHGQQKGNKGDLLHSVLNLATAQPSGWQPAFIDYGAGFVPHPALSIVNGLNGLQAERD
jgi:hypothetical protein